jgi:hypothetical protein
MSMPGFTAGAALYRSSGRYVAGVAFAAGTPVVRPAQIGTCRDPGCLADCQELCADLCRVRGLAPEVCRRLCEVRCHRSCCT